MAGGTLRVHFTTDDLSRVRVASTMDHLWEVVLSLHMLCDNAHPVLFGQWRRDTLAAVRRTHAEPSLAMLATLAPAARYFPDFLTPENGGEAFDTGVDAVMATPVSELRGQLALLARTRPLPGWVSRLAAGEQTALARLEKALRDYHRLAIGPVERAIQRSLGRIGDKAGAAGWQDMLQPVLQWNHPVLAAPFLEDFDLHLNGRGLKLVPSFFCMGAPVKLYDDSLTPTLVCPIVHDPRWLGGGTGQPIEQLLGVSRARILEFVAANPATTNAVISTVLHISPPTVSYHLRILRESGLLATDRDANLVVHTSTRLGAALLNGRPL
ncbi:helix-turn-helix domain-containing protein [Actinocrispum wychmicini]|uniref:Regulatory ArsR family protein n=1 Tax=Actinocrispum wychmicini TaxID=1213861 RepID=A0A4R2JB57_9PSEU|nr:helix-turn-helix domain-containing protein [Actinocrispum wychmicini]TCO56703.1 regulatory ArsR family protein [Actinocrispum wychmicini]